MSKSIFTLFRVYDPKSDKNYFVYSQNISRARKFIARKKRADFFGLQAWKEDKVKIKRPYGMKSGRSYEVHLDEAQKLDNDMLVCDYCKKPLELEQFMYIDSNKACVECFRLNVNDAYMLDIFRKLRIYCAHVKNNYTCNKLNGGNCSMLACPHYDDFINMISRFSVEKFKRNINIMQFIFELISNADNTNCILSIAEEIRLFESYDVDVDDNTNKFYGDRVEIIGIFEL